MSLTAKVEVNIAALLQATLDLVTPSCSFPLTYTPLNLTSGTGVNQADKIWSDTRSIAASSSEDIHVYDFSGGTDALGGTLALARVKMLLIVNKSTTAGDILRVGGKANSTAWTSPFNGSTTATVDVAPGGLLLLAAPSAAAFSVSDPNHVLKIANVSTANSVSYDIIVIGASA